MFRFLVPALLVASPAAAQEFYVRADAGASLGASNKLDGEHFDTAAVYGGAVGVSAFDHLRLELGVDHTEAAHRLTLTGLSGDTVSDTVELTDYAFTIYGDLPLTPRASVFVGGGLDRIESTLVASWSNGNVFTNELSGDGAHWALGAAYRVSDHATADLQYRETDSSFETGDGVIELDTSSVTLGLRVGF